MLASAILLSGCGEDLPKGDNTDGITMSRYGLVDSGNRTLVIDESMKSHFLQFAVSGFQYTGDDAPKEVQRITEHAGCDLPPPHPDARIVYISAKSNGKRVGFISYGQSDIDKAARQFISTWQSDGKEPKIIYGKDHPRPANVLNIVVTETRTLVHLVLGTINPTVYNFVLGAGVRISGLTLISPVASAVANLPAGVPVSYIGRFLTAQCGALPQTRLRSRSEISEHLWDYSQSSGVDNAAIEARYRRFDAYFRKQFGRSSDEGMITGSSLRSVLVGPFPHDLSKRVPYRSIEGTTVLVASPDKVVLGRREQLEKAFLNDVGAAAQRMAGGPLTALNRR